jgi:amino acid transporter
MPVALLTTIVIVTVVYVSIQVVCIGTLPELASSSKPLADASSRFLGAWGSYLISAGAIVSMAGNFNANLLGTSRLVFAMAQYGHLPRIFGAIQPRFRTPYISILFSAGVVLGLALSGTFIQLVAVSVMARVAMYAATCAALPVLRRKSGLQPAKFQLPMGAVIASLSVAVCVWMLSNSTRGEALRATIAAGAGLLLYSLCKLKPGGSNISQP